jgi:hypothetical protein
MHGPSSYIFPFYIVVVFSTCIVPSIYVSFNVDYSSKITCICWHDGQPYIPVFIHPEHCSVSFHCYFGQPLCHGQWMECTPPAMHVVCHCFSRKKAPTKSWKEWHCLVTVGCILSTVQNVMYIHIVYNMSEPGYVQTIHFHEAGQSYLSAWSSYGQYMPYAQIPFLTPLYMYYVCVNNFRQNSADFVNHRITTSCLVCILFHFADGTATSMRLWGVKPEGVSESLGRSYLNYVVVVTID